MSTTSGGEPAVSTSARALRGKTPATGGITKKTKEELIKVSSIESEIFEAEEGQTFLEKGGFMVRGAKLTTTSLMVALLQLSVAAKIPRPITEGMRAVALLMDKLSQDQSANDITEAVIEKLNKHLENLDNTEKAINEATGQLKASAQSNTGVLEEFREECHGLTTQLTDAATELASQATQPAEKHTVQIAQAGPITYANAAQQQTSQRHAASIARGDLLSRQILIDKAPGVTTNGFADLTEKQLVEKATLALDLMGIEASDAPGEVKFLCAQILRGGGVVYQLSSPAAADWLRKEDVMKAFLEKLGGTSIYRNRLMNTVVEYVPTSFDPTSLGALEELEGANGLPTGTIVSARFIKPPHLRSIGQRTAHLIMGFQSRESANNAIENGIFIEGKKVYARKLLQEPKRCLKCQTMDTNHIAAECKSIHDVCARCGNQHKTVTCEVHDQAEFRCSNCKGEGHGAADRRCPYFIDKLTRIQKLNPEHKYRYFPTSDPKTWETKDSMEIYTNEQDATWGDQGQTRGGWTEVRRGRDGRGSGRLAGGQQGEGGGAYHSRGRELDRERNERGKEKQADRRGGHSREYNDGMRQKTLGEGWSLGGLGGRGDSGSGPWGDQNFATGPNRFAAPTTRSQGGQASGSGLRDIPPHERV